MVIHYLVCKVFRNPVEVCIGFSLLQKDRKANDQVICRDMVSIMFEREVTNCVLASSLGKEEETMPITQVQGSRIRSRVNRVFFFNF